MKNNKELFDTIREIARALRSTGSIDVANALEEALSISTVPGEILGEARLRLKGIPRSDLDGSDLEAKVETAIRYLDTVLS